MTTPHHPVHPPIDDTNSPTVEADADRPVLDAPEAATSASPRRRLGWALAALAAVVLAFVAGIGLGIAAQGTELEAARGTVADLRADLAAAEEEAVSMSRQVEAAESARDAAQADAEDAAEREADLDAREQALNRRDRQLDRREDGLDQRAADEGAPDAATGGVSGLTAGNWVTLGAVTPTDDGTGSFEARFRARNDGDVSETPMFTMTLLKSGSILATLDCLGAGYDVAPGQATTVECYSLDEFTTGWTDIVLEEDF